MGTHPGGAMWASPPTFPLGCIPFNRALMLSGRRAAGSRPYGSTGVCTVQPDMEITSPGRVDVGIDPYISAELRSIQRTGLYRKAAGGW